MEFKFNIKPENCKYFIDKKNRKVVCVINNTRNIFINFAEHNFILSPTSIDDPWGIPHRRLQPQLLMPNCFRGIAICSEEDEWNEETGKLIAYSRAKDNLNKSFFKRANKYITNIDRYINDSVDVLNKLGSRLENSTERRHNKISSILEQLEVEE